MPRADAAAVRYCAMYAAIGALFPLRGARLGSEHGVWLASFFLIVSAWAWVRGPALTSSASVSAIAFWKAALIWAWLLPISTAKWDMNSPHAADEALDCAAAREASDCDCDDVFGRKPKLIPAADAVATTAIQAMATAPTAKPATRRRRSFQSLVIMRPLSHRERPAFFMHL